MNLNAQDFPIYTQVSERIDGLLNELDSSVSNEGLNSNFIGRFFVGLVDTFAGLASTFGSNLFRITKSIKRSELHEFLDSNRLKVRVVDGISYDRLVGFKVTIPTNFQGTYLHAIANISNVYIKLNTLNTAILTSTALTNIFKSLSNNEKKTPELIKNVSNIIGMTIKNSKPVVLACQQDFSNKSSTNATFDSLFKSNQEWVDARNALIDMEPRLQEARQIQELVERMEQTLKGICQFLSDNSDNMEQKDLILFGEVVKNVALIMDGYNLAVTRQMALEHNYTLMVNAIYSAVK